LWQAERSGGRDVREGVTLVWITLYLLSKALSPLSLSSLSRILVGGADIFLFTLFPLEGEEIVVEDFSLFYSPSLFYFLMEALTSLIRWRRRLWILIGATYA